MRRQCVPGSLSTCERSLGSRLPPGYAPVLQLTNQVRYIIVIPQLSGIYGNVNRPCPRAVLSDLVGLLP